MENELNRPMRVLSNGAEITHEIIIDTRDEVRFEFELATTDFDQFMAIKMLPGQTLIGIQNQPKAILEYLSDLYTPNSGNEVIVKGLRNKGWITDDGDIIVQFNWKMEVDSQKKISFIYTKLDTPYNAGFSMVN